MIGVFPCFRFFWGMTGRAGFAAQCSNSRDAEPVDLLAASSNIGHGPAKTNKMSFFASFLFKKQCLKSKHQYCGNSLYSAEKWNDYAEYGCAVQKSIRLGVPNDNVKKAR